MQPVLTVQNPFPDFHLLKVYESIDQKDDLIYPIELGYEIFIMRWNYESKWDCNGIANKDVITIVGKLIEEQEPKKFI